ncbi:MAG: DUF3108 domain-containing protein [Melioribacteraceae bacterium]|nr:DUF3108 domain-containing protein [Melioribacteraceae bacterium]MCF8352918.1 DUF3108 domain-containing protein [Melioribacteraceae bacterium]MCF8395259.1 DUF3108 domain-containing protein [Melioribacteraceae bacterium]MCF8417435.1 DUF3108 domain-containing protein [Melioribacteraceae bacterium]
MYLLIIASYFLFSIPGLIAQINNDGQGEFKTEFELEVGEELVYEVKYLFISIGELKFQVLNKKKENGKTFYNAKVFVDSYKGLPFVDLHEIYQTKLDTTFFSHALRYLHISKDNTYFTNYDFIYDENFVKVKKGKLTPYTVWTDSTCDINQKFQDGLSLFFFARASSGKQLKTTVPVFIKEQKELTNVNFYSEVEKIQIDAVSYPISTVRVDGNTNFKGIFGLNGDFVGWFTSDYQKIPVQAKLNVLIGEITAELISWRKKDWNPPEFK